MRCSSPSIFIAIVSPSNIFVTSYCVVKSISLVIVFDTSAYVLLLYAGMAVNIKDNDSNNADNFSL